MRTIISILCALYTLAVPARAETVERARYLMGSACRIAVSHPDPREASRLAEEAFDEIARWESVLSDYDAGSELSGLNRSQGADFTASADLFSFIEESVSLSARTSGAFDLTAGALVDLYALRDGGRWPSAREVAVARARLGSDRILVDTRSRIIRLATPGMRLDPGAIGKGYALRKAGAILARGGARWALLDFGRQVLAMGPGPDGCGFPVEIEPPPGTGPASRFNLRLEDASVATSANSERGLVVDGRPLGHILDPRTALPASASAQATVIASDAAVADALSTALFVLGPRDAMRVAGELHVEAILWPAGGADPILTPGIARYLLNPCSGRTPAPPVPSPAVSRKGKTS